MRDFTELAMIIAFWFLITIAGLYIFLFVFFIGNAILNGFVTVQSCEVTQ